MTVVTLLVLAVVVAVAAAVRSTWSPCGWSMLSTITPISERSRGHRYGVTATWFVVGAVVGGATLGGLAALGALAVSAAGPSAEVALVVAGALGAVAVAVDTGALGPRPPFFHRQVNDDWLRDFRAWVYGVGFGWQIGAGLTTYIMTAGVVLTVALAALTASPAAALGIGLLFGTIRGLAVLLSSRLTSPTALTGFHQRFGAAEEPVRVAVIAVEAAVSLVALAVAWWPAALAGVALGGAAVATHRLRPAARTRATA